MTFLHLNISLFIIDTKCIQCNTLEIKSRDKDDGGERETRHLPVPKALATSHVRLALILALLKS